MTATLLEPFEVLEDFPQDSPAWHEARQHGLGASEVPAVLGLSKWGTPLEVYRTKRGIPREIPADLAYFGHALEPVIAGWIRDRHPEVGFLREGFSARSTLWPWLTASPDRIAASPDHVGPIPVELKTSSAYASKDWADGVPLGYQAQVQTQMAVLGAPHGWLAVVHGGNRPELYRLERDEDWIQDFLVPSTRAFWEDHVLALVPPEPITVDEAALRWPGDRSLDALEADDLALAYWGAIIAARSAKAAAEAAEEAAGLELRKLLGDSTALVHDGQTLVTWKPQAGAKRLDATALRRDHPDLADAYTTQGEPQRRFLPKPPKTPKAEA